MQARRNPDKARYKKPALGGLGGNSLRWSVERDAAVLHPDHQWPFFALLRLDGDGIETPARVDQATLANQPAPRLGSRVLPASRHAPSAEMACLGLGCLDRQSLVRCQIWRCVCSQKIDSRKTVFGNS